MFSNLKYVSMFKESGDIFSRLAKKSIYSQPSKIEPLGSRNCHIRSHLRDFADARHVSSFEPEPHDLNGHLNKTLHREGVTGRAKVLTGRVTRGIRSLVKTMHIGSWERFHRPDAFGCMWPDANPQCCRSRGATNTPVTNPSTSPRAPVGWTNRTHQLCPIQRLITPVTSFRLRFFASSAVENRRLIERNPNPSLPLKLHLLRKCANTTKCSPSCAHVLAFSQIFFNELASH
jgi:hypothetical protein